MRNANNSTSSSCQQLRTSMGVLSHSTTVFVNPPRAHGMQSPSFYLREQRFLSHSAACPTVLQLVLLVQMASTASRQAHPSRRCRGQTAPPSSGPTPHTPSSSQRFSAQSPAAAPLRSSLLASAPSPSAASPPTSFDHFC